MSVPPTNPISAQRVCDVALLVASALFVWSVWPSLSYSPIGLDDRGLLASFAEVSLGRVWGYDHLGHLRPIKNLYFWILAHHPGSIPVLRALSAVSALGCAWLVRSCSSTPLPAAIAAALWLLNPTTAVGVAWLSASNSLFALLGMLLYLRCLDSAHKGAVPLALAHLALLFAVLSHELAMLTPFWALAYRWHATTRSCSLVNPDGETRAGAAGERRVSARGEGGAVADLRWPVLGGVIVIAVPIVLRLVHSAPELAYRSRLAPLQLMASAAFNLVQNVRLWFWLPGRFGVLLSQEKALAPVGAIGAWIVVIGAVWGAWRLGRDYPRERMALVWALLFLLPVINLIPLGVTPVATHYLIVPGVGLAWLTGSVFCRIARHRSAAAGLAAAVLSLCWQPAFRSSVRAYQGEVALYRASLANYPENAEVRVNLIAAYLEAGQVARAQELLEQSLALAPQHPGLLRHQLLALLRNDHSAEALAWFEEHRAWVHSDADLSLRRALLLRKLGRGSEAEAGFEHVLSIATAPEIRATAGYQLANLQVQTGRLSQARTLLRKLQTEQPDHPEINLALRMLEGVLQER